jgi:hypothetical protein
MPCPGLLQRWPFMRKWPALIMLAAVSRALKKRAIKSHLSNRSLGWAA